MWKASRFVACSLGLLCVTLTVTQPAGAGHLEGFSELVKSASPSVVNISTTQKVATGMPHLPEGFEMPELPEGSPFGELFKYFYDQEQDGEPDYDDAKSLGSGFIISEDGYVITNYHVVKGADEIIVRLSDRRELKGEVIGEDQRSDIALLKIEASNLPVAKIGGSRDLEVGDWVLAIGSPFGFDHSATAGIVSAKGRSLPRENYVPFIQTDVAINPGNSGGPLFNQEGEVVGVNSQIYSRTGGYMGLSFSIPIEVAMDVVEQLKSKGRVSRGWLGVLIQDVTLELAESFGMKKPRGALVAKVLPDSPAQEAGIQVGDVIVRFNGNEVVNSANLPPLVGSTKVGVKIPVEVVRNSKTRVVQITLGELPEEGDEQAQAEQPAIGKTNRIGITLSGLSEGQMTEQNVTSGVLVTHVVNGAASRGGVRKDDIILAMDGQNINSVKQFTELVDALPADKTVAMLVQRSGSPTFLAVKVPVKE
jgi:serine protease Do